MSRINLGEVFYLLAREGGAARAASLCALISREVEIVGVSDDVIDRAAMLKGRYRISYADAFAATLAGQTDATLVTGDPDFHQLAADRIVVLEWVGA